METSKGGTSISEIAHRIAQTVRGFLNFSRTFSNPCSQKIELNNTAYTVYPTPYLYAVLANPTDVLCDSIDDGADYDTP
jgi:hypothetical protein